MVGDSHPLEITLSKRLEIVPQKGRFAGFGQRSSLKHLRPIRCKHGTREDRRPERNGSPCETSPKVA